jgi:hypothetical protein
VFLSVRPEEITVASLGAPAIVRELTFLGGAIDYKVSVGPTLLRVRIPGAADLLSPGQQIAIRLPARLHVLQTESQPAS